MVDERQVVRSGIVERDEVDIGKSGDFILLRWPDSADG
jgi:hypothetical protein